MHEMMRQDILSQDNRLNILLSLEEETSRNREASGLVQISNVHQPLSLLACDFVSHDTVKYIKAIRNTFRVSVV